MGFNSFLSALLGSKSDETPEPPRQPRHANHLIPGSTRIERSTRQVYSNASHSDKIAVSSTVPPATAKAVPEHALNAKRKSTILDAVKPKPGQELKKRRSWFGHKPDTDEEIPEVPALVQKGRENVSHQDVSSRHQAVPVNKSTSSSKHPSHKNGRFSIGRTLVSQAKAMEDPQAGHRRRPSFGHLRRPSLSRSSWFDGHQDPVRIDPLPPLPPMPVTVMPTSRPSTSALPSEKQRSRAGSLRSVKRANSRSRSSRGFWASSNPDDCDLDPPMPVPGLSMSRDGTPESLSNDSVHVVERKRGRDTARQPHESNDIRKQRSVSVSSQRSYNPKNASQSFLVTTNGASDAARLSYRRSFRIDADADMICLTDEQRVEWAKLMNEARSEHRSYKQPTRPAPDTSEKAAYSNAQALAALEFGIRT